MQSANWSALPVYVDLLVQYCSVFYVDFSDLFLQITRITCIDLEYYGELYV
jgi:hypothetical protein